jgi:hypothetical protein
MESENSAYFSHGIGGVVKSRVSSIYKFFGFNAGMACTFHRHRPVTFPLERNLVIHPNDGVEQRRRVRT